MMKYVAAISATGNARTTTVRGYSPEEFSKLAAEAPRCSLAVWLLARLVASVALNPYAASREA